MSIIQSLEDAQRVFGELDMWTKAWTDCDGVIRWAEEFSDISLAPPLCHIDRWGALDMWTGAWTDCDGVIRWAEQSEAFKVFHEIEEESSSDDDDDEWVMTAREVGAIVGVDKSVSCV